MQSRVIAIIDDMSKWACCLTIARARVCFIRHKDCDGARAKDCSQHGPKFALGVDSFELFDDHRNMVGYRTDTDLVTSLNERGKVVGESFGFWVRAGSALSSFRPSL